MAAPRKQHLILYGVALFAVFSAEHKETVFLCADENCKEMIAEGKTQQSYPSDKTNFLTFEPNQPVKILGKSSEAEPKIYFVEINGERGYAVATFIREGTQVNKNKVKVTQNVIDNYLNGVDDPGGNQSTETSSSMSSTDETTTSSTDSVHREISPTPTSSAVNDYKTSAPDMQTNSFASTASEENESTTSTNTVHSVEVSDDCIFEGTNICEHMEPTGAVAASTAAYGTPVPGAISTPQNMISSTRDVPSLKETKELKKVVETDIGKQTTPLVTNLNTTVIFPQQNNEIKDNVFPKNESETLEVVQETKSSKGKDSSNTTQQIENEISSDNVISTNNNTVEKNADVSVTKEEAQNEESSEKPENLKKENPTTAASENEQERSEGHETKVDENRNVRSPQVEVPKFGSDAGDGSKENIKTENSQMEQNSGNNDESHRDKNVTDGADGLSQNENVDAKGKFNGSEGMGEQDSKNMQNSKQDVKNEVDDQMQHSASVNNGKPNGTVDEKQRIKPNDSGKTNETDHQGQRKESDNNSKAKERIDTLSQNNKQNLHGNLDEKKLNEKVAMERNKTAEKDVENSNGIPHEEQKVEQEKAIESNDTKSAYKTAVKDVEKSDEERKPEQKTVTVAENADGHDAKKFELSPNENQKGKESSDSFLKKETQKSEHSQTSEEERNIKDGSSEFLTAVHPSKTDDPKTAIVEDEKVTDRSQTELRENKNSGNHTLDVLTDHRQKNETTATSLNASNLLDGTDIHSEEEKSGAVMEDKSRASHKEMEVNGMESSTENTRAATFHGAENSVGGKLKESGEEPEIVVDKKASELYTSEMEDDAKEDTLKNETPFKEEYTKTSSMPVLEPLGLQKFLKETVQFILEIMPYPVYEGLLEMKASGLSLHATVVTFIAGLLSILLLSLNFFIQRRSKEFYLKEKLCLSEQQFFKVSTERDVLREELETTKQQTLVLHKSVQEQQTKVKPLQKQLESVKNHNSELRTLAETLREQMGFQEGAMNQLQEERLKWNLQSQALEERANIAESRLSVLTEQMEETRKELSETGMRLSEKELWEREWREKVCGLEETRDQLLAEAREWNTRVAELHGQIETCRGNEAEANTLLKEKSKEAEELNEVIEELRFLETANEETRDQVKEKLADLLDVAKIRMELKHVQDLLQGTKENLTAEIEKCTWMEARVMEVEENLAVTKESYQKVQLERAEAQTKLEVLSTYFREKETHLQKELGAQVAIRQQREDFASSAEQKVADIVQENTSFKEQLDSMRVELQETERSLKAQVLAQEKKAHENWLAARTADRKLEEAKQESATLRQRLTLLERERDALPKLPQKKHEDVNGELVSSDVDDPDSSSSVLLPQNSSASALSDRIPPPPPPFPMIPLPLDRPLPPPPFPLFPPAPLARFAPPVHGVSPSYSPEPWHYRPLPPVHLLHRRTLPPDFERRSPQGQSSPPRSRGGMSPPRGSGRTSPARLGGRISPPPSRDRMSPPYVRGRTPPPHVRGRMSPPPTYRNGYRHPSPPRHYDYDRRSDRFSPGRDYFRRDSRSVTPPHLPRFHDVPPVPLPRRDYAPNQPPATDRTREMAPAKTKGPATPV